MDYVFTLSVRIPTVFQGHRQSPWTTITTGNLSDKGCVRGPWLLTLCLASAADNLVSWRTDGTIVREAIDALLAAGNIASCTYNCHYNDVIMGAMASQITTLTIVYSTVYSGADQRKHQSSASLAFVRGIHRGPVNSPHKWPVTRAIITFDDVIM